MASPRTKTFITLSLLKDDNVLTKTILLVVREVSILLFLFVTGMNTVLLLYHNARFPLCYLDYGPSKL